MNLVLAGRGRSQGQNLFIPEKRRSFNNEILQRGQKRRHTRNVKMTNNVFVKRSFEYTKLVRSLLKHTGNRKALRSKPKSAGTTVCFVRGLEDQTGPCSDTIRSIRFAREKRWSTVVLRRTSTDPFGQRRFLFTWSTTILLSRRV